jgi:hypothetical protein
MQGEAIRVSFRPELTVRGGRLESRTGQGAEVHAGSFLRKRVIVLEEALLHDRRELGRIFVHELFHFAWLRLGNQLRGSYGQLVQQEWTERARGELGWSAESRKAGLTAGDLRNDSRRWREYLAESFCDTAAWLFHAGPPHPEWTLAQRFRRRRRNWFESLPVVRYNL